MTRVAALVPMRHHSQRVAGKNYRPFAGRPLYHWIVESLLQCPEIGEVVVDTDSPVIAAGMRAAFPSVRLVPRPEALAADDVSMNQILLHDIGQVDADLYLQTHCTNPLLKPASIRRAIQAFIAARPHHDSLFSVTRMHTRLWDAGGRPMNHDPAVLLQTQDLPPVFEENSCLYLFTAAGLRERGTRIGARPMLFELERREASDIDEEVDFEVAEILMERRLRGD
jgi:CMP-N-acetylneuraminic acid synthetase